MRLHTFVTELPRVIYGAEQLARSQKFPLGKGERTGRIGIRHKALGIQIVERPQFLRGHKFFQGTVAAGPQNRALGKERRAVFRQHVAVFRHISADDRLFVAVGVRVSVLKVVGDFGKSKGTLIDVREIGKPFLRDAAQNVIDERQTVHGFLGRVERAFEFVAAADERDTRVTAKAGEYVFRFRGDLFDKFKGIVGNITATEHEILPDHDALFVAFVVKNILFVIAAAPYAQHIEVCPPRKFQERFVSALIQRARKTVGWHPVGALAEHGRAVYFQAADIGAHVVRALIEFDLAHGKPPHSGIERLSFAH